MQGFIPRMIQSTDYTIHKSYNQSEEEGQRGGEVTLPNPNTTPQLQPVLPFPCLSSPSYIWVQVPVPAFTSFYQSSQSDLMPGHQWMICGTCHSWGSVMMAYCSSQVLHWFILLTYDLAASFSCTNTEALYLVSNKCW